MSVAYTLFATPLGACGIAWSDAGVCGLQLPEGDERATRLRMSRRFPGAAVSAPPPFVAAAIGQIDALLRREPSDLESIALDMRGVPALHQQVYAVARRIPPCRTLTYGEVARRLGHAGRARAVGQALGRNPFAIIVPCHRVVAAGGAMGGFSAHGGAATKLRLLALEGFDGPASTLPFEPSGAA